jgi:hypothetical protein
MPFISFAEISFVEDKEAKPHDLPEKFALQR